jgi:hypothetical protein
MRARCDAHSHADVDAHISLTVPLAKQPDDSLWGAVKHVASGFRPIAFRYGPLVPYRSLAPH